MTVSIADAHVHLWDTDRRSYAWLREFPAINRTFLTEDYDGAHGASRVDRIVFVECAGASDGASMRDEVNWVLGISESEPRLAGIVAFAPLERGADVRSDLQWLSRRPLVKGVRRLIQHEPDPEFCLRPDFVEGIRMLAEFDLSFDLCIFHHQLPAVVRLVEQCPDVSFILDHLGKPAVRDGILDPWREHLRELAALPNVACKISGVVTEADHNRWTETEIRPYIETALEAFGPDRVMFGGDWPVVNLASTWEAWIDIVRRLAADMGVPQDRLFVTNAERVYRLGNS
jgi:L-fuconolactonase